MHIASYIYIVTPHSVAQYKHWLIALQTRCRVNESIKCKMLGAKLAIISCIQYIGAFFTSDNHYLLLTLI